MDNLTGRRGMATSLDVYDDAPSCHILGQSPALLRRGLGIAPRAGRVHRANSILRPVLCGRAAVFIAIAGERAGTIKIGSENRCSWATSLRSIYSTAFPQRLATLANRRLRLKLMDHGVRQPVHSNSAACMNSDKPGND